MKVWLDDERPAPSGWVHVKTAKDAIRLLCTNQVDSISLDNDLGEGQPEGKTVARIIEEGAFIGALAPVKVMVHSMNTPALREMLEAIKKAEEFWKLTEKGKV
jgi:hypothetical protein